MVPPEKDPPTPSLSASSGDDPIAPEEAYGPIWFRRYAKGDGRALILYTHGDPADGRPADERPAQGELPREGHERA